MKKLISLALALALLLACVPSALAVDNSRKFFFELPGKPADWWAPSS
jgi:hypothetical protein